jgi:hypothetical protein
MRWLAVFLLMSSPVFANSATTSNVLPNLSTFTTSGSTTSSSTSGCTAGEFCTGNASAGGGTYTSTFNVPLTEAEVQRGFTLDSSVTVDSHQSNSVLATCTSVGQAGDCRDLFTLGVTLLDGDAVAKKFTHEVELDFTGNRLFSFSDSIAANSFGILTGSFSLFGIDAGFHSGFFGPKFSDPTLSFTYQNIIEQQILDQIAVVDQQVAIAPPPPVEIIVAPPVSSSPPPAAAPVVVAAAPEAPPPPPEIAPIQIDLPPPPAEQQQQESQAEADIEAQIEQAPEPAAEPEASSSPEETTEAAPEAAPESEPAAVAPKPTRQQKIKAAAQKVVSKIAPSQRYSSAAQTTMLVAMGMIAPRIATTNALVDVVTMPTKSMSDDRSLANPMQNYTLFGSSNGAHEALVQLDWKR